MTSIGSRRATRAVPVVFLLLLAVLCGRYLLQPATPALAGSRVDGTPTLSAPDHGVFAVVSRVPAPVSEAKLDLGDGAPIVAGVLLTLLCSAALVLGHGSTVQDLLGGRCRRRGPPALVFT